MPNDRRSKISLYDILTYLPQSQLNPHYTKVFPAIIFCDFPHGQIPGLPGGVKVDSGKSRRLTMTHVRNRQTDRQNYPLP